MRHDILERRSQWSLDVAKGPPAATGRGSMMVEAAGQLVCLFRDRLDYAFTPARAGGGACYPKLVRFGS